MEEIGELESQLTSIVRNTCNTVGCNNCDLKFGGFDSAECAATDLQGRIMDIEMSQLAAHKEGGE